MKKKHFHIFKSLAAVCLCFIASGCARRPSEVWDDTKTCGRHMARGLHKLTGRNYDSRQVMSKEEFMGWHESCMDSHDMQESDYIPLVDNSLRGEMAMVDCLDIKQPRQTPGDPYSSIPGIEAFKDPATIPGAKDIFYTVHFEYNSNLVKGDQNLHIIQNVAEYLKRHPNTYIFVEGHCDERGPEAYNLALGMKRSNAVRSMLVQQGANPENIFTVSYGKERPLAEHSNEQAWALNRRVEFKIYYR